MISSLILSLFLLKKLPLLRKSCGPWTPRLALLGALWQPARSPSPRSTFAGFKPGPARHEHFLAELKASGGAEHNSATCRKPPRIAAALRRDALHHFPLNFAPQPTRTDPQAPGRPSGSARLALLTDAERSCAPAGRPAAQPSTPPHRSAAPAWAPSAPHCATLRRRGGTGRTAPLLLPPRGGPRRCGAGARSRGRSAKEALLKTVPPAPSGEAGRGASVASIVRRDAAARGAAWAKERLYARAAEKRLCTQRRLEALVRGLCHPLAIPATPMGASLAVSPVHLSGALEDFLHHPGLVGHQWESGLQ